MNLSKETTTLIRNFANINGSIMLKQGNKLATISEGKNIMAETTIAENIPSDFGIYDLSEFLNAASIFDAPVLTFADKYITISDAGGKSKIKFYAAGEGAVKTAPATIKFPTPDVEFDIDSAQLATIMKTSSALKAPDISIVGDGTTLKVLVSDKKNATSNAYEVDIGTTDQTFKANLKIENLKMLPGNYSIAVSSKKISRFTNKDTDLTYYVAIEADSEF
jgi:hypothetical protein